MTRVISCSATQHGQSQLNIKLKQWFSEYAIADRRSEAVRGVQTFHNSTNICKSNRLIGWYGSCREARKKTWSRKETATWTEELHVATVTMCTFVLMYMNYETCSQFVDDSHTLSWMHSVARSQGRRPLSTEQPGRGSRLSTAGRLMDVTMHYMHHSLNTVLPLKRMPFCPYINAYGLQHVITVISSSWRNPHQSSLVSPQWGMLKGCGATNMSESMLGEASCLVKSRNNCWLIPKMWSNSWWSNVKENSWDLLLHSYHLRNHVMMQQNVHCPPTVMYTLKLSI